MKLAGNFFQLATKIWHLNRDWKSRVGIVSETGDTGSKFIRLATDLQWATWNRRGSSMHIICKHWLLIMWRPTLAIHDQSRPTLQQKTYVGMVESFSILLDALHNALVLGLRDILAVKIAWNLRQNLAMDSPTIVNLAYLPKTLGLADWCPS